MQEIDEIVTQENEAKKLKTESAEINELDFLVVYKNERLKINIDETKTILDLKEHLQTLTNIPPTMQKIMYKGLAKDESTLKSLNIRKGDKLMLIGSTLQDVAQVSSKPQATATKSALESVSVKKGKLCEETVHKKVLDKFGKPEDVLPGILNSKESLPDRPLTGMINKIGHKVRLTFKFENDELWISTKERTDKIPMSSIKSVISEPISGHEEYHLMGIQIGSTEASRYWVYWVPAQFISAIRDALL